MKHERAKRLGQEALIYLAGRPDLLDACLAESGLDGAELRRRSEDPVFLGFLLDFLLQNDSTVQDFAADAGVRPEEVAMARALLGGALPNWT